jgi:class 3 adenylate cyclase/tetratricopeptide (TPR) repeat protein
MTCPSCGTANADGAKFCVECGTALAQVCPACGMPHAEGQRFCAECGAHIGARDPAPSPAGSPSPAAERRLVSVLFADLVGFTALSESRDPEDVRELLTRYFDTARQVIGRYGGTVEKFIGDAVMAVWGAPVAREDDAGRAVRSALELVAEVATLGAEVGAPELRLRAGVTTGEAAVTLGAEGQGMVAGDLVNTASRVQSAAGPGTVLVDETTLHIVEAAIACEAAGSFELRGKEEPLRLWRALRVTAGRGGALKSVGLEAPFVGREGEIRLIRELFHAAADEGRARLVSVVGVAGIGKSRIGWEFFKYIDGLLQDVWWHRGRCLAYGEGVAYWALAEMVMMRSRIAEDEPPESALEKLHSTLTEILVDDEERAWVEPRLQHLLGLAERTAPDREDLFSAWRLFFERLAETSPTVLLFEDLQWADAGLLDFIEYLLDWSRNHPIYVVTIARLELFERRPGWGAGTRNVTSIGLEPLPDEAMGDLLHGLAPGLPVELSSRIRARAEGIPLYAVETVRMLLDRGLLEQRGTQYGPTGPIEALEVPETLQALIAARLDGIDPAERRLLQDASVLGRTFTMRALAAVSGRAETELEPLLASLVRKEILGLQTDPRSPERGQYGFLQALVEKVAGDTLARRERKVRHLRAAAHFESGLGWDEEELAEIIASHYVEAYETAPDAEDGREIRAAACRWLTRAAERSSSLAASGEAERYYDQAAQLADDELVRAGLLEQAGVMAWVGGRGDRAEPRLEEAIGLFAAAGESHAAARVSARLAETLWDGGRLAEGLERMERSFDVLSGDPPDGDFATLAAQLGRVQFFAGQVARAAERIELALETAEALRLPEVTSEALNTKSLILYKRPVESLLLLEGALKIALENELPSSSLRAYFNIAEFLGERDRAEEALACAEAGLELARRRGDRNYEWDMLSQTVLPLFLMGRWDEALARAAEIPEEAQASSASAVSALIAPLTRIQTARGDLKAARSFLTRVQALETSDDLEDRASYAIGRAVLLRTEGDYRSSLCAGEEAMKARELPIGGNDAIEGWLEATEAAFALAGLAKVEELLDWTAGLHSADRTRTFEAHEARFRARLADRRGEAREETASARFRELGIPFWLAVSLVEESEALVAGGRAGEAEPLTAEAREIFEQLGARPWLERLDRESSATEHAKV